MELLHLLKIIKNYTITYLLLLLILSINTIVYIPSKNLKLTVLNKISKHFVIRQQDFSFFTMQPCITFAIFNKISLDLTVSTRSARISNCLNKDFQTFTNSCVYYKNHDYYNKQIFFLHLLKWKMEKTNLFAVF